MQTFDQKSNRSQQQAASSVEPPNLTVPSPGHTGHHGHSKSSALLSRNLTRSFRVKQKL